MSSALRAETSGLALPAGLTPAQAQAVKADADVLCVLAGAGAGKTRVLTLRVARRVRDGSADAGHLLVTTFSRKAADELRRRLWMLGVADAITAGTFHHCALALLRQHRADRDRPAPTVLGDRRSELRNVLREWSADAGGESSNGARGMVAQLDTEIGWAKARMVVPDAYEAAARTHGRRTALSPGAVAQLYERYEEVRRRRDALDLDDLLWAAGDLLEEDRAFADAVRWRFRHVFVDEMQDVNPAQFRLLASVVGDTPDLFVVGDPNQSVYGWNGADPKLLDRLPERWPATLVVRLDENHRCSPQIVAVASAALGVSRFATPGPTSTRPDGSPPRVSAHATDAEEAAWVAHEAWLAHRPGRRWSHLAVLARTNAQLTTVAQAFDKARIPYHLAGGELGPGSDVAATGAPAVTEPPIVSRVPAEGGDDGGGADDGVVLTTFHRAKGLQWPVVFVVGLADGLVPISWATTEGARDEERRLLYVALTRAEDELSCSWSLYRDVRLAGTGWRPRQPSPWLGAIEATGTRLARAMTPPDTASVTAHLAELRARLGPDRRPSR